MTATARKKGKGRAARRLPAAAGPGPGPGDGAAPAGAPLLAPEDHGELLLLDPDELEDSPLNPRRDYKGVDALADSMRAEGFTSTVLAHPLGGGRRALVYGHRRKRAAKLAGVKMQVDMCRRTLTDREVRLLAAAENCSREDLGELEEADHFALLRDEDGLSAEEIAAHVGRSKSHVHRRLALAGMAPQARAALEGGLISVAVAQVAAGLPRLEDQVALVKAMSTDGSYHVEVGNARHWVRDNAALRLADAPFETGRADLLPEAGPCGLCPKRTGTEASAALFDFAFEADLCTDRACWRKKERLAWAERKAQAKTAGLKVLTREEAEEALYANGNGREGWVSLDQTVRDREGRALGTYRELLPEEARPPAALARCEEEGGQHVELLREAEAAAALAAAGVKLSGAGEKKKPLSAREKKAAEKERRARQQKDRLAAAMIAAVVEAAQGLRADGDQLWALVAELAARATWADNAKAVLQRRAAWKKGDERSPLDCLARYAAGLGGADLRGLVVEVLLFASRDEVGVQRSARELGVDRKAVRREVAAVLKEERRAKKAKARK